MSELTIDWAKVTELRDDVGAEAFAEVIDLFLEEVAEILGGLDGPQPLEEVLHALKGAAATLGFTDFSKLCADGERAAASGNGDWVDRDAVRLTYAKSREEFLRDLHRRCAA